MPSQQSEYVTSDGIWYHTKFHELYRLADLQRSRAASLRRSAKWKLVTIFFTVALMALAVIILPPVVSLAEKFILNSAGLQISEYDMQKETADQAASVRIHEGTLLQLMRTKNKIINTINERIKENEIEIFAPVDFPSPSGAEQKIFSYIEFENQALFIGEHIYPGDESKIFIVEAKKNGEFNRLEINNVAIKHMIDSEGDIIVYERDNNQKESVGKLIYKSGVYALESKITLPSGFHLYDLSINRQGEKYLALLGNYNSAAGLIVIYGEQLDKLTEFYEVKLPTAIDFYTVSTSSSSILLWREEILLDILSIDDSFIRLEFSDGKIYPAFPPTPVIPGGTLSSDFDRTDAKVRQVIASLETGSFSVSGSSGMVKKPIDLYSINAEKIPGKKYILSNYPSYIIDNDRPFLSHDNIDYLYKKVSPSITFTSETTETDLISFFDLLDSKPSGTSQNNSKYFLNQIVNFDKVAFPNSEYLISEALHKERMALIELKEEWIDTWNLREQSAILLQKLQEAELAADPWRNISSISTRLAVIALLIYLVNILVNLYRYQTRLAAFYQARHDAIEAAIAMGGDFENRNSLSIAELSASFTPEEVSFGSRPNPPTETIANFVKEFKAPS